MHGGERRRGSSVVNLDALADLFLESEARGQPIVYRPDREPPEHIARLMRTLGVEVIVTAISAHELTRSRDCIAPLCPELALKGLDHCRAHAPLVALRVIDQSGRDALAAMDAGLPQPVNTDVNKPAPESAPTDHRVIDAAGRYGCKVSPCEGRSTHTRGPLAYLCPAHANEKRSSIAGVSAATSAARIRKWKPEEIIDAIQRWAAEHDGVPPTANGWKNAGVDHPTDSTVAKCVGSFSEALRLAGFEPRSQGAQSGIAPKWTKETAIDAVRVFVEWHGRVPKAAEGGRANQLPALPFSFGGTWSELLEAAGYERYRPGGLQGSGRAAMGQEPTAPVEETLAPPGIDTASRDLRPAGAGVDEVAARPDDSGSIPESPRNDPDEPDADELAQIDADRQQIDAHIATLELPPSEVAKPEATAWDEPLELATITHGTFSLALTGDFTSDAQRVRNEAAKLRAQAQALDVIASGIDQLAETTA